MNPIKTMLRQLLKRLLKQFEENLDIFTFSEKKMVSLKSQLDSKNWEKLQSLPPNIYLNRAQLSQKLDQIFQKQSDQKARIFKIAIDPHRLFALEFQDQKKGKKGPIGKIVREVCRGYKVPDSEVEDWIQEVCLKLSEDDFHKLRLYSGESSFLTYLITVIQRICIDQARAKWGRRELPEKIQEMGELAEKLFVLLYWEGKSFGEAAQHLKLQGGAELEEEAEVENFEKNLSAIKDQMAERLGILPQPNVRYNLEEALKQGSAPIGESLTEGEMEGIESLSSDERTPEEAIIISDSWRHFNTELSHAQCLYVYVLTPRTMEKLIFKIDQAEVLKKLDSLLYLEFEKESDFLRELEKSLDSSEVQACQAEILKLAFRVSPRYLLMLKRFEEGISAVSIAKELEMSLSGLYSRVNALKSEMVVKGWEKSIMDQFFKR
ncbi:MAG: sigma-70 family RNA polymerase sigma factor [SAR324 cluster bacterium]|nr:sigma-70 family RNA polymerase sigma factor [SAR324 cluster bacterium]